MYSIEVLNINENASDYEKYKGYEIDEQEICYIGDKYNRSRIGVIKNKNDEIKFVFSFNYIGLLPQILFIPETKLIFLGAYDKVLCISENNYKVLKQVNYDGDVAFFEFIKLEKKILMIFEMSVYMINDKGEIIWFYDAQDIIVNYTIKNNKLKIKFFDLSYTISISLDTGRLK